MRRFALIAILIEAAPGFAQTWCAPGATWVYEYTGWGTDVRRAHYYVGDTLVFGQPALMVEVHTYGYSGGNLDYLDTIYNAIDGEVVLQWKNGVGWDTLYWFGETGDRWWPLESPMTCPPRGMLEIIDTSTVAVHGLSLRSWLVAYLDEQGQPYGWDFQLTERIGSLPPVPQIDDCSGVIDYFFCEFLCYTDSEMMTNDPSYCAIDVGLADRGRDAGTLLVVPNPALDVVLLSWAGAAAPIDIHIGDASGRVVMTSSTAGPAELVLKNLPGGFYVVRGVDAKGRMAYTRMLKR